MGFIEQIAPLIQKYAPQYNICVCSPIIAQAILESGSGTSNKVYKDGEWRHNYFGLKWRNNRCTISNDYFEEWTSEQRPDGSRYNKVDKFCKFKSMEDCVIGYFQWTNISNYAILKGVTDPKTYLENIKADGYATSLKYVSNLMAVIQKYDLTKYDKVVEVMGYTNSPLVSYTKLSPNNSGKRTHSIDRIAPHCVVGQLSVESLGNMFANPSRKASSNYGIGADGRVGMYVEEKDRSWCTSSNANDQRAVTIECASDTKAPYAFNDAVYNKLIDLCVDICKRNGKSKLLWIDNKDKALAYQPKSDEMLITVHRWFAAKSCPGDWLYSRLGNLASEVTKRLSGESKEPETKPTTKHYRVQVGYFGIKKNAENLQKRLKEQGFDAIIVEA